MALPEHTKDRSGSAVLITFTRTLDPPTERAVHTELAKAYPGAAIATIGDRQVTVLPVKAKTTRAKTTRPKL
jgi:hypothetical protein